MISLLKQMTTLTAPKVGIDFGSTQMRVFHLQRSEHLVTHSPMVAFDRSRQEIIAIGREAEELSGRVGSGLEIRLGWRQGTITDTAVMKILLQDAFRQVLGKRFLFPPVVMVSVSSQVSRAERQLIQELLFSLGSREVLFIHQVLVAGIGAGVPVAETSGNVLLHLGGEVSEMSLISIGGIVVRQRVALTGSIVAQSLQRFLHRQYHIGISNREIVRVMTQLQLDPKFYHRQIEVTGQDLVHREVVRHLIPMQLFVDALTPLLDRSIFDIGCILQEVSSEFSADMLDKGILLTGGLAQIGGIEQILIQKLGLPVSIAERPEQAVIEGLKIALEQSQLYKHSLFPSFQ